MCTTGRRRALRASRTAIGTPGANHDDRSSHAGAVDLASTDHDRSSHAGAVDLASTDHDRSSHAGAVDLASTDHDHSNLGSVTVAFHGRPARSGEAVAVDVKSTAPALQRP